MNQDRELRIVVERMQRELEELRRRVDRLAETLGTVYGELQRQNEEQVVPP